MSSLVTALAAAGGVAVFDVGTAWAVARQSRRRVRDLDGPAWAYVAALATTGWVLLGVALVVDWGAAWPLWVALGHGVVASALLVGAVARHGDRSPR